MWAAGVMASPAGQWLGAETDRAGRVKVDADLSVPGHPEVFVIGDTAALAEARRQAAARRRAGRQAAGQVCREADLVARAQGETARAVPLSRLRQARHHRPQARGRRSSAGSALSGFLAWLLWSVAHIYFLIGFRNRFVVALNWPWNYVTFQRGTRLITGVSP